MILVKHLEVSRMKLSTGFNDYEFYVKSINSFTKKLQLVQNSKPETFKKSIFSFAQEIYLSTKKGRKKKGRLIAINSTSKSRHLCKARGSSTAPKGRPKNIVQPKQRGADPVSHFLPKRKKVKRAHPHNLSASVAGNRAAEKKQFIVKFTQLSFLLFCRIHNYIDICYLKGEKYYGIYRVP